MERDTPSMSTANLGRFTSSPPDTLEPPNLMHQALNFAKGIVGISQQYFLRNETACTVKALITEDPEALKIVGKAKGGVGLEFVPGAGPASKLVGLRRSVRRRTN